MKSRKSRRNGSSDADSWMDEADAMADADTAVVVEEAPPEPEIDPLGRIELPQAGRFHWGVGRRKASVARVRLRPGSGQFVVNGRSLPEFLPVVSARDVAAGPVSDLKIQDKVDVFVSVSGGGPTGQGGAIRMGLARALAKLYPDAHEFLRRHGHLSRDARMVERKKYGRAGARRSFQWVKR